MLTTTQPIKRRTEKVIIIARAENPRNKQKAEMSSSKSSRNGRKLDAYMLISSNEQRASCIGCSGDGGGGGGGIVVLFDAIHR